MKANSQHTISDRFSEFEPALTEPPANYTPYRWYKEGTNKKWSMPGTGK